MGRYLNWENSPSMEAKRQRLTEEGAERLSGAPESLSTVPDDKAVICLGDRGFFAFAAWCWNPGELSEFRHSGSWEWYLLDKTKTEEIAVY